MAVPPMLFIKLLYKCSSRIILILLFHSKEILSFIQLLILLRKTIVKKLVNSFSRCLILNKHLIRHRLFAYQFKVSKLVLLRSLVPFNKRKDSPSVTSFSKFLEKIKESSKILKRILMSTSANSY